MKGWELYIWQEDGNTCFALLMGTNRLKSDEEISKAAVKGVEAIKPGLDELKPGQRVSLHGRRRSDRAPDDPAKEVGEYGKKIGLDVHRY
jgi:hypothetical protein